MPFPRAFFNVTAISFVLAAALLGVGCSSSATGVFPEPPTVRSPTATTGAPAP